MSDPNELCQCGDRRVDHFDGMGECILNGLGHGGAPPCISFRLASHAPSDEAAEIDAAIRYAIDDGVLVGAPVEHDFPGGFGACRGCGKFVEELIDERYCSGKPEGVDP